MVDNPIDGMTHHELRLEYLRLAGWTCVVPVEDNINGAISNYLFGIDPHGNPPMACPDPTTNIADAMEALKELDQYKIEKDPTGVFCEVRHGEIFRAMYGSVEESDLPIEITRAVVAALREVQGEA